MLRYRETKCVTTLFIWAWCTSTALQRYVTASNGYSRDRSTSLPLFLRDAIACSQPRLAVSPTAWHSVPSFLFYSEIRSFTMWVSMQRIHVSWGSDDTPTTSDTTIFSVYAICRLIPTTVVICGFLTTCMIVSVQSNDSTTILVCRILR